MSKEEIAVVLKQLRLESGYTQKEAAEKLGKKQQTIASWETGQSQPDANTLFIICSLYGITVDEAFGFKKRDVRISKEDIRILEKYHDLDDHGRETVDFVLDREILRMQTLTNAYQQIQVQSTRIAELESTLSKPSSALHLYAYMNKIACAGIGFYFEDIPSDIIEAPFVEGTDFIIGVSGDSMKPDYYDGERLYVQKVSELTLGDIGIFTIRNECFVKELGEHGLVSRNPNYDEIWGTEDVRLIGRVLGKVED